VDSLTAHYLARVLAARWSARRVSALRFDRDARAVIVAVDGSAPVRFPLAGPEAGPSEGEAPTEDSLHFEGWTVAAASAPEDDRRLRLDFERRGKFRGSPARRATLEISFVPNARGARLTGDGGDARLGARIPPVAAPRPLLEPAAVARIVASPDRSALLAARWMSPKVIEWIGDDPETAAERYPMIAALPADAPPPVGPLFARAGVDALPDASPPLDDRRARAIARMERELAAAAAMPLLRDAAAALFALGDATAPREIGLSGGPFPLAPRPGERATALAERLLDDARSMERALTTLPARIGALRAAPVTPVAPVAKTTRQRAPRAARPYREYRSSGGLDIWVGRGSASNDELTFRIADAEDVWMHARDVAGAHVVLRWTRPDPPPPRDLAEAAAIAAWHSRSRGSTVAPVDWTRRKHVRKPRGGPPGLVLVDKVKTVNARPSAALERALRREDGR